MVTRITFSPVYVCYFFYFRGNPNDQNYIIKHHRLLHAIAATAIIICISSVVLIPILVTKLTSRSLAMNEYLKR